MSSPATVLFVAGGSDVMRWVYETHGMGYWSAAFDVILEKHGWLDFRKASPDVLAHPEALRPYEMLLVAWLPEPFWSDAYVASLESYEGVALIEGPLPPRVERLLGIRRCEGEPRYVDAWATPHGEPAKFPCPATHGFTRERLRVSPRFVATKPARHDRRMLDWAPLTERNRVVLSYALTYRQRHESGGQIFDDPAQNALAVLAWIRLVRKLKASAVVREDFAATARSMLRGQALDDASLARRESAVASAVWRAVHAESVGLVEDDDLERDSLRLESRYPGPSVPAARLWNTYADAVLWRVAAADRPTVAFRSLAAELTRQPPERTAALQIWLLEAIGAVLGERPGGTQRVWLDGLQAELQPGSSVLPRQLEGWKLRDLLLAAAALSAAGCTAEADLLVGRCIEKLLQLEEGSFLRDGYVRDGVLEIAPANTLAPTVALALLEVTPTVAVPDAASEALRQYAPALVEAWAQVPYWIEPCQGGDGADALSFATDSGDRVAVHRAGRRAASSFQIFSYIAHLHTIQPLPGAFGPPVTGGDFLKLEHFVFHLLELMAFEHAASPLTIAPWPWGARYCLTIRHDVDRIPSEEAFERLLAFERRHELGASWFWLAFRTDPRWISRVLEEGHEVGLHAASLTQKPLELEALRSLLSEPATVAGEALHGAGDDHLGYSSIAAAAAVGFAYTDAGPLANVVDYPLARVPRLTPDGTIERTEIAAVGPTATTDGADPSLGAPLAAALADAGWYCQVLNHPDINFAALRDLVEGLPSGRVNWTCARVASWWRATHRAAAIEVVRAEADRYTITAREDITDLEVRVIARPDEVASVEARAGEHRVEIEWRPEPTRGRSICARVSLTAGRPIQLNLIRR